MAGIYEVNDNTTLVVKVEALMKNVMDNNALAAKVEALTKRFDVGLSSNSKVIMLCETCGAEHATTQCPIFVAPQH